MGVSLFKVGRIWHFRFQVGGVRIQRSTGERYKPEAEEVAEKAYRRERMLARGEEPTPTLAELAEKWIAAHRKIASRSHIRSVETFRAIHLYGLGDRRIDRIRTDAVENARLAHLETRAPATANHWLRILKLLFQWAVKRKMIAEVPWSVRMQKIQKKPRVILPVSKAREWIEAVDLEEKKTAGAGTAIRLMLGLGLREAEALGARWEWVDWERGVYTPGITKGREADPVPMASWIKTHLKGRRRSSGLICEIGEDPPPSPATIRRVMSRANAKCGIVGLTPHRLRGTYATLLSESGVPVQDVQRVMRHKDPKTTMGYLEMDHRRTVLAQEEIARRMGL